MLLVGFLILITIAKPSRKLLIWIDLVGLIGLFLVSIVIYFDRKSKKGLREILKNKFKYSKEYKRKRRSPTHTEIQERLSDFFCNLFQ